MIQKLSEELLRRLAEAAIGVAVVVFVEHAANKMANKIMPTDEDGPSLPEGLQMVEIHDPESEGGINITIGDKNHNITLNVYTNSHNEVGVEDE